MARFLPRSPRLYLLLRDWENNVRRHEHLACVPDPLGVDSSPREENRPPPSGVGSSPAAEKLVRPPSSVSLQSSRASSPDRSFSCLSSRYYSYRVSVSATIRCKLATTWASCRDCQNRGTERNGVCNCRPQQIVC
eukprot:GHVS01021464.1.p1 GENE.GHVS01021464.1~~GHVS01021464.1.p1  ORF type:complete len:148 (-),score=7.26 GHVS01021464.1:144-548(-)